MDPALEVALTILANPRGFCAGINRAISIVENALAIYGAPNMSVTKWYVTAMWWIACVSVGLSLLSRLAEYRTAQCFHFSAHGVSISGA